MAGFPEFELRAFWGFSFGQRCKIAFSDGADGRGELLAAAEIVVIEGIEGGT